MITQITKQEYKALQESLIHLVALKITHNDLMDKEDKQVINEHITTVGNLLGRVEIIDTNSPELNNR